MKRIVLTLLVALLMLSVSGISTSADASLVSNRKYRVEQKKLNKQDIKDIKNLFEVHGKFANEHDKVGLSSMYSDNYMNNDGFDKQAYFKSIESTWKDCKDITYTTKILSISVTGDHASVNVEETSTGTIHETIEEIPVAGEIHSKSLGIYHLTKINSKWYISGETAITDESSLLYGDARFMNIEIQAPAQVSSGEEYTATVKVDTNEDMFVIGSIDRDPVTYPTKPPKSDLRALNSEKSLERVLTANTDNINEYAVASLAISKVENVKVDNYKIYMAGLACVMKRVNVVPKNNFVNIEE